MIKKDDLLPRMRGINGWISENPNVTDPNMYEMLDCVTSIGVAAREEDIANSPGKFPQKGSELYEIYKEWYKMYKARMSSEKVIDKKHPANINTNLYKYFSELNMICCTGDLPLPEDKSRLEEYLECLKKIGSINLYINQQERDNPQEVYDISEYDKTVLRNSLEFKNLLPRSAMSVIKEIQAKTKIRIVEEQQEER